MHKVLCCYNTFYNLNNMALCVCGNCTEEEVLALCDKMLKKSEPVEVERVFEEEPDTIVQPLVEEKLPVACPMFQFGVKEAAATRLISRLNRSARFNKLFVIITLIKLTLLSSPL